MRRARPFMPNATAARLLWTTAANLTNSNLQVSTFVLHKGSRKLKHSDHLNNKYNWLFHLLFDVSKMEFMPGIRLPMPKPHIFNNRKWPIFKHLPFINNCNTEIWTTSIITKSSNRFGRSALFHFNYWKWKLCGASAFWYRDGSL